MTGYILRPGVFSRLTFALLEDSGYDKCTDIHSYAQAKHYVFLGGIKLIIVMLISWYGDVIVGVVLPLDHAEAL